ncbi:MAG: ParB/RepB/Spo0J family partition protein [Chloroflexi bacterium]|nr:ParB/RepB/Spo0J family partition protein [Chloroflexota bacterium]
MLTSERSRSKSFRDAGSRIFQQEQADPQNGIIRLLASRAPTAVRDIPVDKIQPNPSQPRMTWHEETLKELAASITEHGVLQPILVRPAAGESYEFIAGERRWRASKMAKRETIPAIVERFDDATALEIALIENLQREDLSPLDEAFIYNKMTTELGYSIRGLAGKLGKDKGYVENRLRLANAPDDVKEMVAQRYDTITHAYELMKLDDKRKRRALVKRVLSGEMTLLRLHERVERILDPVGRPPREDKEEDQTPALRDDAMILATRKLNEALMELAGAVDAAADVPDGDRQNLAKFLTISRARLDNLVARIRSTS